MYRSNPSIHRQRATYVITDWVTTNIAFVIFNVCRFHLLIDRIEPEWTLEGWILQPKLLWEQALFPLFALGIYWLSGYYLRPFAKSRVQEFITTFISAVVNASCLYLVLLTNDLIYQRTLNYRMLTMLVGVLTVTVYIGRLIITQHTITRIKNRNLGFNTLIIGNSEVARRLAGQIANSRATLGYRVKGFVTIPHERQASVESLPEGTEIYSLEEVAEKCKELEIHQLIISPEETDEELILSLLYRLFHLDIPIRIRPDLLSYMTSSIHLQDIFGEPFIDLTSPRQTAAETVIKRALDCVVSAIALLLLTPVYAVVALAVKSDSPGPVFFRQERIGRHHKPFMIVKFRTMRTDAEAAGPQLSKDNDPRITRVGAILRKYRIDELPQFWNVLRGDMAIVGPRPEREYYIREIVKKAPYYTLVHQIRPGITSWGMVKYGYASNVDQMVKRVRFELIYLSNMTLSIDLKILIYTVRTILQGKGK